MKMTHTHTVSILDLSPAAFEEIRAKLADAGYHDHFHTEDDKLVIDMWGIAVQAEGE